MSMASRPHSELVDLVRSGLNEGLYRASLSGPTDHEAAWWNERQDALSRLQEQYEELGRDLDGKAFLKDAAEAKIRRLEEQLEALRQRLVKTRAEAEEYRELWQEAEGRS